MKIKNKLTTANILYLIALCAFITAISLAVYFGKNFLFSKNLQSTVINTIENLKKEKCDLKRAIDGVCVKDSFEIYPKLVAVMIENHPDSRPQSGLSEASIVYEAPVEANYSRFLAIYPADSEAPKVGPVRSARPYYLDWVSEYGNPLYTHVGGSDDALNLIKEYNIFDLNEFYYGWYFWRSKDRFAPHNTYISSELWNKAWNEYGNEKNINNYTGWKFEEKPEGKICEANNENNANKCSYEITASFFPPSYEALWKFNTSTNQYDRYQTSPDSWTKKIPHIDSDGSPISADTLIIQAVKSAVLDSIGRQKIYAIGKGDALIFKNGFVIKGTWKKTSRTDRTMWLDEFGNEIELKAGKIWVEVINKTGGYKY
jgi:hypothetical protein